MLKKRYPLLTLLIGLFIATTATDSFGQQETKEYNDNSLNMASIGSAFSMNLWSSGYVGFNLKKNHAWTSPWSTFSDSGNNGAAGVIGGIGGDLLFVTIPSFQASSGGQTFQDAEMPSKIRMTLNGAGQLRIGPKVAIGSHTDYRLSVYGKLTATSLYVLADNATNWADYVFADDYKLMPLPELESYLKTNRHLPEMPTTCDVETEGINVGAMNTLLLKKVEELTLHLIELNKKVAQLEEAQAAQH